MEDARAAVCPCSFVQQPSYPNCEFQMSSSQLSCYVCQRPPVSHCKKINLVATAENNETFSSVTQGLRISSFVNWGTTTFGGFEIIGTSRMHALLRIVCTYS